MYYKTLKSGTLEGPASNEPRVRIDALQLAMLLSGGSLRRRVLRLKRMSRAPSSRELPQDLASRQALIEQLALTVEEFKQKQQAWEQEKQELQLAYAELLSRAWSKRLRKLICKTSRSVPPTRRRLRRKRQEYLGEHLPRVVVDVEAPPEVSVCLTHGPRLRNAAAAPGSPPAASPCLSTSSSSCLQMNGNI